MATYVIPINSPIPETGDDIYCKPTDSDFAGGATWGDNVISAIEVSNTNVYQATLDETDGYIVYLNGTSNTFAADDSSNEIIDNAHGLLSGEIVRFKGLTLPGGLSQTTLYYVIDVSTNRFRVSLSAGGAAVNLTTAGSGTMVYVAISQRSKTNDIVLGTVPVVSTGTLTAEAEASLSQALIESVDADGYDLNESLRLLLAALTGKVTATTTSFVGRAANDSKNRITATTTTAGSRTAVTLDAT